MGKHKTSVKQSTPVRLPHDGPVNRSYRRRQEQEEVNDGNDDDASSFVVARQAAALLHIISVSVSSSSPCLEEETVAAVQALSFSRESSSASARAIDERAERTIQLLKSLQHADKIQEQLHALRAFKSWFLLLNRQRHPPSASTSASSLSRCSSSRVEYEPATSADAQRRTLLPELYRILLECCWSAHTPATLRRALQSVLEVLVNQQEESKETGAIPRSLAVDIQCAVFKSLLQVSSTASASLSLCCWSQPLHSLQEALQWESLRETLLMIDGMLLRHDTVAFLATMADLLRPRLAVVVAANAANPLSSPTEPAVTTVSVWDQAYLDQVNDALEWACLVKTVLGMLATSTQQPLQTSTAVCKSLQDCLWILLTCRAVASDNLSTISIAYGRVVFLLSSLSPQQATGNPTQSFTAWLKRAFLYPSSTLTDLQLAALLQGLAVTCPVKDFMKTEGDPVDQDDADRKPHQLACSPPLFLETFVGAFEQLALSSPDPQVRQVALQGIQTIVNRCCGQTASEISMEYSSNVPRNTTLRLDGVANRILEVVIKSWEKPPTRRLAHAIASLFESLVRWMQQLESSKRQEECCTDEDDKNVFSGLINRLLTQPPNRKGRYLALETLLPLTGAQVMLLPLDEGSNKIKKNNGLLEELLSGIGDNGHNTRTIADLWALLLGTLLEEMISKTGNSGKGSTETKEDPKIRKGSSNKRLSDLPDEWLDVWVPSLAKGLYCSKLSRRKALSAFCLPRVVVVVDRVVASRETAGQVFIALLRELERPLKNLGNGSTTRKIAVSQDRETIVDRILWSKLEIARTAAGQSWFRSSHCTARELRLAMETAIPLSSLRSALTHHNPSIRVIALQSMGALIETYHYAEKASPLDMAKIEISLWKYMLPLAVKTEGREYTSVVLECLLSFLDRLMSTEAASLSSVPGAPTCADQLELTFSFISDFLLGDLLLFLGYPGTAAQKEAFMLSMLECIAFFAAREFPCGFDTRLLPKSSIVFDRKRRDVEMKTLARVRRELVRPEVFASLFSILQGIWDAPRTTAYKLFKNLLVLAREASLPVFSDFSCTELRPYLVERGILLASSARPRAADTGSRLLAILCHSLPNDDEKLNYVSHLTGLLEERLQLMQAHLTSIVMDTPEHASNSPLPLTHGLVHSLQLVVENDAMFSGEIETRTVSLFNRMADIFIQALQVSLSIVADVRDDETMEGSESDTLLSDSDKPIATKINRGCINANGIFSSVNRVSEEEARKRLASQRIVVGTWLLTKETCAAIASIIAARGYNVDASLADRAGMLLISTLTSIKHAGAAFAAQRAMQQITQRCLDKGESRLQSLPSRWMNRLLDEVSEVNRVRNSTLRRSTGYAFGFLSIMRAEVASRVPPHTLCGHIMSKLLRLALPAQNRMQSFLSTIRLGTSLPMGPVFSHIGSEASTDLVADCDYERQSRIHALNVLRLIILDAPLAEETFPFIGEALACSIIGYTDPAWAVRNSSTMVFAAVMLRSVDADKNAKNSDPTSRNATSAAGFFRSYPSLPNFLLSVMRASLDGVLSSGSGLSLPPVLPILLLLARLQPVGECGSDAMSLTEPFVADTLRCLENRELVIRKTAARALANLSSREKGSAGSIDRLAEIYASRLSVIVQASEKIHMCNWNQVHGTLVAIHELLKASDEGKEAVQNIIAGHALFEIDWIKGGKLVMPETCLSTLIDIFSDLDEGGSLALRKCCNTVTWLEGLHSRKVHFAGMSELGTKASQVAVRTIGLRLWNCEPEAEKNFSPSSSLLSLLADLLKSPCIDIRIAAVKSFKKGIYAGLDKVIEHSTKNPECAGELLMTVTSLVADVLLCEMHRVSDSTTYRNTGPHPPTLRRVSRCLIECLSAADQVGLSAEIIESIRSNLEDITAGLLSDYNNIDLSGPDSRTFLLGNTAELVALVAASRRTMPSSTDDNCLAQLLAEISDPCCHWRLRHSAACALGTTTSHPTLSSDHEKEPHNSKLGPENVFTWAKLVQDEDVDVRFVVSTAWTFTCLPPLAPERTLSSLFAGKSPGGEFSTFQSIDFAFTRILDLSLDVEKQMIGAPEKFLKERTEAIFEQENPNVYGEEALSIQFALLAATKSSPWKPCVQLQQSSVRDLSDKLVRRCHSVLTAWLVQIVADHCRGKPGSANSSIFLDPPTRRSNFVPLHSLLVGSACALLCFDHTTEALSLRELASDCLAGQTSNRSSTTKTTVPHPCILQALRTLSQSTFQSETTKQGIASCLFLVKLLVQEEDLIYLPVKVDLRQD